MNSGERLGSGGRRGSRGRSSPSDHWVPVRVDRSSDESSGSSGRGFRGRGRGRGSTSYSPRNTYGCANAEHTPVRAYVPKKSSQVSTSEEKVQQDTKSEEVRKGSSKFSGDNQDLLQSSVSPSSKNIKNLSEGSCRESVSPTGDVKQDNQDLLQSSVSPSSKNITNHCESLSVSVSSTSDDQRAALSSFVDNDNVHKSGAAGNSSTERNKRPFDLFLVKNVMGLKPSLLKLNKEKRNAAKEYTGIVIRPGMVLLKNYLSINDQVMIVNKCRQLGLGEGGFYQPGYADGALLHLKMMCLGKNWDPETSRYGETRPADGSTPPKIPVEFSQFVEKAIKESQSLAAKKGSDVIPNMLPDICIVNFYESAGRLGLHQDKDESSTSILKGLPVVSFSIGDSAEFLYGDERDEYKADKLVLESGDVLLFGGKSRSVFHGVRSIVKDSAPKVLGQKTNLRPGRLNLTFRQY